jgi:hypothetical protein
MVTPGRGVRGRLEQTFPRSAFGPDGRRYRGRRWRGKRPRWTTFGPALSIKSCSTPPPARAAGAPEVVTDWPMSPIFVSTGGKGHLVRRSRGGPRSAVLGGAGATSWGSRQSPSRSRRGPTPAVRGGRGEADWDGDCWGRSPGPSVADNPGIAVRRRAPGRGEGEEASWRPKFRGCRRSRPPSAPKPSGSRSESRGGS